MSTPTGKPPIVREPYTVRTEFVAKVIEQELERQYHVVPLDAEGHAIELPPESKVWVFRSDPSMPRELWEAGLAALTAYAEALKDIAPSTASGVRSYVELQRVARLAFDENRKELEETPDALVTDGGS